jgi:hypothetical protein
MKTRINRHLPEKEDFYGISLQPRYQLEGLIWLLVEKKIITPMELTAIFREIKEMNLQNTVRGKEDG